LIRKSGMEILIENVPTVPESAARLTDPNERA